MSPGARGPGARFPLDAADLVGTWRLRSWVASSEDDAPTSPFGADPDGIVVYTGDGTMITTISRHGRPPIGGDVLNGPSEPRLDAFGTFIAYSGSYRVVGRDVVHTVEMSLFPDWVGGEQLRHVELSDDGTTLTLSTDPTPVAGRLTRNRLTWERVST